MLVASQHGVDGHRCVPQLDQLSVRAVTVRVDAIAAPVQPRAGVHVLVLVVAVVPTQLGVVVPVSVPIQAVAIDAVVVLAVLGHLDLVGTHLRVLVVAVASTRLHPWLAVAVHVDEIGA